MRQAILTLWLMGMGARCYTLIALFRLRLVRRYPALTVWLGAGLVKSFYLLSAFLGAKYAAAWLQAQYVSHLLYLGLTIEIFILQASHFPVFRFAIKAAVSFAGLSACAAFLTSGIGAAAWSPHVLAAVGPAGVFLKNYTLACFVFLQLGSLLWGSADRPFRPNVSVYARVASAFFAVEWISAFMLSAVGGRVHPWSGIAQIIGVAGPLACYCAFAVLLKRDGHNLPPDPPPPQFSVVDLEKQEKFFVASASGGYRAAPQFGGSKGQVGTGSSASETEEP